MKLPANLPQSLGPALLALVLLSLGAVAVSRILALRSELGTQVMLQLEARLGDQVGSWEDDLLSELNMHLGNLGSQGRDPKTQQQALRGHMPWLDSIYLWQPAVQQGFGGVMGGRQMGSELIRGALAQSKARSHKASMLFPKPAPSEDNLFVSLHPCMRQGRALEAAGQLNPDTIATKYIEGCSLQGVHVRLAAAHRAATLLQRAARYAQALRVLDDEGGFTSMSLRQGVRFQIPPYRLVELRMVHSQILLQMGHDKAGLDLYLRTGLELAELDAPDAAPVEQLARRIQDELERHGATREVAHLEMAMQRARRRIAAWNAVKGDIMPRATPNSNAVPRFMHDPYGDPPFLLYYGSVRGEYGAALQLDQPALLAELLHRSGRLADQLVIVDSTGRYIAGARRPSGRVALTVPFTKTLKHLRVGVYQETVSARLQGLEEQWLVPLVVTGFCMLLGMIALSAQLRANARLRDLVDRQREFTTRVTHELKTPIAGIRVMAENLEAGAFRSPEQARSMAARIVDEADRLAARVNEVLNISERQPLPQPEPFDPEEPVLEAVDTWGPRLERYGVRLSANLDLAPEVVGDRDAVRDAIGCLLDNALKYRDPQQAEARVDLSLTEEDEWAVITVDDNGLGVPAAQREHIFEAFTRVEGPHRGKAGGHGLGLAQVTRVAELHGGSVQCTDSPLGGARFVLRLKGRST